MVTEVEKVEQVEETQVQAEQPKKCDDHDNCEGHQNGEQAHAAGGKHSRMEKKAKKSLMKFGLTPVDKIVKVMIRQNKKMSFSIDQPEVYKNPTSNTFIVFGEPKIDDAMGQGMVDDEKLNEAKMMLEKKIGEEGGAPADAEAKNPKVQLEEDDDIGDLDETDIDMICKQCTVSRGRAISALKAKNGDVVDAIMLLTEQQN